jgi:hypothetical protein
MPTIILSYRRDDTGAIAGRIFDRLVGHYGADQVFMDIDSIPFGLDFREHIQETLKRCDVLLAIVGKNWAAPDEKGGFRIEEENDWVRIGAGKEDPSDPGADRQRLSASARFAARGLT